MAKQFLSISANTRISSGVISLILTNLLIQNPPYVIAVPTLIDGIDGISIDGSIVLGVSDATFKPAVGVSGMLGITSNGKSIYGL